MVRRAVDPEGRKVALNMRTTQSIRERLEGAAAQSGRSLTHEVEYRVERSFDIEDDVNGPTNAGILRDIRKLFRLISFDGLPELNATAQEGLAAAFAIIVAEHLPRIGGLMADVWKPSPEKAAVFVERMKKIAEGIAASTQAEKHDAWLKMMGDRAPKPDEKVSDWLERLRVDWESRGEAMPQSGLAPLSPEAFDEAISATPEGALGFEPATVRRTKSKKS